MNFIGLSSDYGGHLPENTWLRNRPVLSGEQYVLSRIDYYKEDGLSDMETVQMLLTNLVVSGGRNAWYWLRLWYEKKLLASWETYKDTSNNIAKSIDEINQRLIL